MKSAPDAELRLEMLSELATMKVVSARTSIPVPAVYHYECGTDNPFGRPYILMEAMPGRVLEEQFAFAVPAALQPKVAAQFAHYVWELSQVTFDQIGDIWCGPNLNEASEIVAFPSWYSDRLLGPFNFSASYLHNNAQEIRDNYHCHYQDHKDWDQ